MHNIKFNVKQWIKEHPDIVREHIEGEVVLVEQRPVAQLLPSFDLLHIEFDIGDNFMMYADGTNDYIYTEDIDNGCVEKHILRKGIHVCTIVNIFDHYAFYTVKDYKVDENHVQCPMVIDNKQTMPSNMYAYPSYVHPYFENVRILDARKDLHACQ